MDVPLVPDTRRIFVRIQWRKIRTCLRDSSIFVTRWENGVGNVHRHDRLGEIKAGRHDYYIN